MMLRKRWFWILIGLTFTCCAGLCVVTLLFAPSEEELAATRTIEAQAEIENDTKEAIESATEIAAQNATATIIALTPTATQTPTATFTRTPTITFTPTKTLTPTASPTVFYEPVPDAQGRVPDRYQELIMTLSQQVVDADSFLDDISEQVVKYDDTHPDGFFVSFTLDMSEQFNEDVIVTIRQVVRNVLFDFYGTYSYLAIKVKAHDDFAWEWDSETNETVMYMGDAVVRIEPTETSAPRPTDEPEVESASGTRYVATDGTTLNVRACPASDCARVGRLNFGDAINLTGIDGDWYQIEFDGGEGWVMSQYTSSNRPSASSNSGSNSNSGGNVTQPTQAAAPPVQTGGCGGASTCGEMSSCEQAYACLQAGDGGLDRDKDGIPCEDICGG